MKKFMIFEVHTETGKLKPTHTLVGEYLALAVATEQFLRMATLNPTHEFVITVALADTRRTHG